MLIRTVTSLFLPDLPTMADADGDDVSRETSARERAEDFFDSRFPLAASYVELLRTDGIDHGLIGPREGGRLWARHVLNCAVLRELLAGDETVADVGSGAGLPGIPLAITCPGLRVTLVEPLERRAAFLVAAVEQLGLGEQIDVVRSRAEDLAGLRGHFDVVTARAVAPVAGLLGWTVPLVRSGGRVIAMKGVKVEAEVTAARRQLRQYGVGEWRVHVVGEGIVDPPTRALELNVARREPATNASRVRGRGRASADQRTERKGGRQS